jgi:hypothetical protein
MGNPITYFETQKDVTFERLNSLVDELGTANKPEMSIPDGTYNFYTVGSGYVKTVVVKNGTITRIVLS